MEGWNAPAVPRACASSPYNEYKNLIYMGKVKGHANYGLDNRSRKLHPFSKHLRSVEKLVQLAGDTFFIVKPTTASIEKSIQSFEDRPLSTETSVLQAEFFQKALIFFERQYAHLFEQDVATSEEIAEFIDFTKSCGYIGTWSGYRTKADLIKSPEFRKWLKNNEHLKTIPLWSVSPKTEYKELADIMLDKIRLFTIPPFDLLYEQIRFGKKSSLAFKEFKWSAYGFNPYFGGVNKMAQRLLRKRVRFFYDLSGWDKYIPLMKTLYSIIRRHSKVPDELKENFEWMIRNTQSFAFKTPFGDCFIKRYGNPSGSGTTTRDNISMHIILIAGALIEAYYLKHGKFPTQQLLNEQILYIFGDDIIGSVDEDFDYITQPDFFKNYYARFGMKLKYCRAEYDLDLEEMDFLGFKFKKLDNRYYPLYNINRLASSAIYSGLDDGTLEPYLSRFFTLMIMSYPSEHFSVMLTSWHELCDSLSAKPFNKSPTIEKYLSLRNITDREIRSFYCGTECAYSDLFLIF